MGRNKKSPIRDLFVFEGGKSVCKQPNCHAVLQGSHYSNLKRHLERKHPDILCTVEDDALSEQQADGASPAQKRRRILIEISEEQVVKAMLHLITKDGAPLKLLDSTGFRMLADPIFAGLNMNVINSHNIVNYLSDRAGSVRADIKKILQRKLISLKIDCATRQERSVVGVNVQLFYKNSITIKTLAMIEMHEKHTSSNIKYEVLKVLESYGIDLQQIFSVTTDNARNMVAAINMINADILDDNFRCSENKENNNSLDYEDIGTEESTDNLNDEELELEIGVQSIRCAAHTLNLAVEDVLLKDKAISTRIDACRKISKKLRNPTQRNYLRLNGAKQAIIDVKTRWNSTYDMIQRLTEIRQKLNDGILFNEYMPEFVEMFIEVFQPVKETTIMLQSSNLTPGDFYKIWMELKLKTTAGNNVLAQSLAAAMASRESTLLENDLITSALFVDPRFHCIINRDEEKKKRAQMKLKQLAKQLHAIQTAVESNASEFSSISATSSNVEHNAGLVSSPACFTDDTVVPQVTNATSPLLEQFLATNFGDNSVRPEATVDPWVNSIYKEIENFSERSRAPLTTDVLKFWAERKYLSGYIGLSKIATILHSVPATQVSVERNFSALKFILSDYRNRLTEQNLQNILLIRLNT